MTGADHRILRLLLACCLCAPWIAPAACLAAEEPEQEERACDLPPFDQVVLDEANGNAVLKVELLDFPDRKVPVNPTGDLTIRLLIDPTRAFDVSWQNIRQVILFEDFLYAEAKRLTESDEHDEAFDYYARLLRDYPQTPGLNQSVNEYLRRNAQTLVEQQNYDRALAVLSTLYQRAPNTTGIRQSVDTVCSNMVEKQLREKNYAAARGVLRVWRNEFQGLNSPAVAAWEQRFATAAERQISDARQQISANDFVAARRSISRARDIWPDSREADQLLAEIQRRNPTVSVGVFAATPAEPVRRLDDWASLRTSDLRQEPLARLVGFGSEGGLYESSFGAWEPDATGMRLSLNLSRNDLLQHAAISAADVARTLLNMADPTRPEYNADFADVVKAISVAGDDTVHIDWKHPHVRPEAWFQQSVVPLADAEERSPWRLAENTPNVSIFEFARAPAGGRPWLRAVVEQTMSDDRAAIESLLRGEIDVLDRVPPWQLARLRARPGVRVANYALPTVHALVLNPASELAQHREFRRAVCYTIPRERILKEVLLGGEQIPGFKVLSGPFPAGLSPSDPLSYAYNNRIAPRPFEPRLGAVLASVAWGKIKNPNGDANYKPQPLPTLVLAHPADPLARLACESIKIQLTKAGIPIELVEFTSDELVAGNLKYDLRYAEIAVWEPLIDARALLGPTGLAGALSTAYLESTLNSLSKVANWRDARSSLAELHNVAHHDLPIIPLWQTVNYFAYRDNLQGIGEAPVTLYQFIDQWQLRDDSTVAGIGN